MLVGILAQISYILLFMNLHLNILISLAVAGITFSQIHKSSKKILMLTVGLITAQLLGVSYGWYSEIVLCTPTKIWASARRKNPARKIKLDLARGQVLLTKA